MRNRGRDATPNKSSRRPKALVRERRFDSIAWLIQGDEICGASCFDGENLLLATNEEKESPLVKMIKNYLISVAKESSLLKRNKNETVKVQYQREKKKYEQRLSALKKYADENIELMRNETYRQAFMDSLGKMTRSLLYSYLVPEYCKAFPKDLIAAIRNGKIKFVPGEPRAYARERVVHAELKIVQKLIDMKKLGLEKSYCIGISKRCCRNCEAVIKAANVVMGEGSIREEIKVTSEGHGYTFPAKIPAFFKENRLNNSQRLTEEFLRIVKRATLEEAFDEKEKNQVSGEEQLLERSESKNETSEMQESRSSPDRPKAHRAPVANAWSSATTVARLFPSTSQQRNLTAPAIRNVTMDVADRQKKSKNR